MVSEEGSLGARGDDWHQISVFQTQQDWPTYELTETAQAGARWVPSMRRGSGHALPPIPRLHLQLLTQEKLISLPELPWVCKSHLRLHDQQWRPQNGLKGVFVDYYFFLVSCRFVCAIFLLYSLLLIYMVPNFVFTMLFCFLFFFLKILKFSYLFSKDRKKESIELDEWGGGEDL